MDTGAVDAEAAAFLRDQRHLINLQAEHLHEQRQLQLAHLRVRRWKDRMSLSLQVLAVFAGAVLVVAFAGMAWHAHEDHGLLIDAFEVPPELAADGVSGSVLAQRFLDKFNALQTATDSDRPAASFQNNWGDDIKVEIPETGLKLGEVRKLLRDYLGHVSHVTGDVYKTATGIALTARLGDAPPRWGKNQLRWSESLLRIGYEREAKAYLERASHLSLSSSERAELDALAHQIAKPS